MQNCKRFQHRTAKILSCLLALLLTSRAFLPSLNAEEPAEDRDSIVSETTESLLREDEGGTPPETSAAEDKPDAAAEERQAFPESVRDENYAEGFAVWFNPDKETAVTAGQQGSYPVYALSDMQAKGNSIAYDGEVYYTVQGKKNPKTSDNSNPKGKVPATGAAMMVKAPADGSLSCFGKNGSGKTFYITAYDPDSGETEILLEDSSVTDEALQIDVQAGREYWFYAQGSKYQFAGFVFSPPEKLPVEICVLPLAVHGKESAGEALAEFYNEETGYTVSVSPDDTELRLKSGLRYTIRTTDENVSVSPQVLDLEYEVPENLELYFEAASGETDDGFDFLYFGTSTGSDRNKILPGADIRDEVRLISCLYDEETGAIIKKGGKYVADAPADGQSLYYTTINPAEENFFLQADVYIDYMNPSPDGQEGFALLVRDSLNGSGSYFSNLFSVAGTKLPKNGMNGTSDVKDLVGVRAYTGIVDPEDAARNDVKPYRMGFKLEDSRVEQGRRYRLRLEKRSYAYVMSMLDPESDALLDEYIHYIPAHDETAETITGYDELADPAAVQEKERAYVALSAARGVNATFSNIIFKTSPWKAEEWHVQPTEVIAPDYAIISPETSPDAQYTLRFKANADGRAALFQNGKEIAAELEVRAGEVLTHELTLDAGETLLKVKFTPDPDFRPGPFLALSDYSEKEIDQTVRLRSLPDTIYVTPEGAAENSGASYDEAVDLETALAYVNAGQTILLQPGRYDLSDKSYKIERGRDGTAEDNILVQSDPDLSGYAVLDFGKTGGGIAHWGNHWTFRKLAVTGSADGKKGMQLAGKYNTVDRMLFYNNGNTGLQVSGTSKESYADWPAYNTILNSTSMNNADAALEDADGFGAKLTIGPGNVFDGCIAAYNADDGWDLFAKAATGSVGPVLIKNSLSCRNGYLLIDPASAVPADRLETRWDKAGAVPVNTGAGELVFPDFIVTDSGELRPAGEIGRDIRVIRAGNGNGFKMGGTNLPGAHEIRNSIAYENKAKGFDSNSCPDIKVYQSTSYNNDSYNIALYTNNKSAVTDFAADQFISYRRPEEGAGNVKDRIRLQEQSASELYHPGNYFWDETAEKSLNSAGDEITQECFISLDTSIVPGRRADGGIDMKGLLLLTEAARAKESGAQGAAWGQEEADKALFWVVGDSTAAAFKDAYYLPRQGYGEALGDYFSADVYNLAVSGASSKDYCTKEAYQTLLNGSENVPALGTADPSVYKDSFLWIAFGHNDEKPEALRYTDPNGDYKTEGSFARSLYLNYIKPALERRVTPVLVSPPVRLTEENTRGSYAGPAGHITDPVKAGDQVFPGGDYAGAVRGLYEDLKDQGVLFLDLCALTLEDNVAAGEDARAFYAHTSQRFVRNEAGDYLDLEGEVIPDWDYARDYDRTLKAADGLDKTHTNLYGAKRSSRLLAEAAEGTKLEAYVKETKRPVKEEELPLAVNPDYRIKNYTPPEERSDIWPVYTDGDGHEWYATVFGDIGGQGNVGTKYFAAEEAEDGSINLKVSGNKGKISSKSDGYLFYYTALPAGTPFRLQARARILDLAANNQVSFGLMARDDLYIDRYISETMGDYVAAASRNQGSFAGFGRKDGKLRNGPEAEHVYAIGDTLELEIRGTAEGFSLRYGDNAPASEGFDYPLTATDPDSVYVGFFVTRNAEINFSDIHMILPEEKSQAERWPAVCRNLERTAGDDLAAEDFVENFDELPEGTRAEFSDPEAADTAASGRFVTTILLTYPDGSTQSYEVRFEVKDAESGESEATSVPSETDTDPEETTESVKPDDDEPEDTSRPSGTSQPSDSSESHPEKSSGTAEADAETSGTTEAAAGKTGEGVPRLLRLVAVLALTAVSIRIVVKRKENDTV